MGRVGCEGQGRYYSASRSAATRYRDIQIEDCQWVGKWSIRNKEKSMKGMRLLAEIDSVTRGDSSMCLQCLRALQNWGKHCRRRLTIRGEFGWRGGAMNESDCLRLPKAVSGWLFCQHEVTRRGFDFSVFDLDYLLQQILAGVTVIVQHCKLTKQTMKELNCRRLGRTCSTWLPLGVQNWKNNGSVITALQMYS